MDYSDIKVAILGAGPSAAYINLTCLELGIRPTVYSDRKVGAPGGSFWLRTSPALTQPPERINILSIGSSQAYMEKQWGKEFRDYPSSFPTMSGHEMGYSPVKVWDSLWRNTDVIIRAKMSDAEIGEGAKDYDVVFMTFPTQESKQELQQFLHPTPVQVFESNVGDFNAVIYNGVDADGAVRTSILFGKTYIEHSNLYTTKLPNPNGSEWTSFMDLHPDTPAWDPTLVPASNVVLIGRYAEWSRKALSHEAASKSRRVLEDFARDGTI